MATSLPLGIIPCITFHTLLLIIVIATPTFGDLIDLLEEAEDCSPARGKSCLRSWVLLISVALPSHHYWSAIEII